MIRDVGSKVRIAAGSIPPFDLGNQSRQRFSEHGRQRGKAPTMHAADDNFRLVRARGGAEDLLHDDRRGFRTFDAKSLLRRPFCPDEALKLVRE